MKKTTILTALLLIGGGTAFGQFTEKYVRPLEDSLYRYEKLKPLYSAIKQENEFRIRSINEYENERKEMQVQTALLLSEAQKAGNKKLWRGRKEGFGVGVGLVLIFFLIK